jgi:hypothetical protein
MVYSQWKKLNDIQDEIEMYQSFVTSWDNIDRQIYNSLIKQREKMLSKLEDTDLEEWLDAIM